MAIQDRIIFSVGHSNHPLEKFLSLLRASFIDVLVDVRSHPYSRYNPQFNTKALQDSLSKAGIKYLFFGKELGGRPKDDGFYGEDGNVDYSKLARSPLFIEGIDRLEKGIADYRIAIMCSEENPNNCHRRLLITPELEKRGIKVLHIRGDGRLESETDLLGQETQPTLFKHSA
jgi:uncharacterized protein (DUF488 family)